MKILRIGLLKIECERDFSRFCTDLSEFLGAWPQENLRIRPSQIECESNFIKLNTFLNVVGLGATTFFENLVT